MRVGLHSNQLSIRGSEVALWDYADGLEARGHFVRVFADATSPYNDPDVVRRFQERFDTVLYGSWDEVKDFGGLDFLYMIKAGLRDDRIPSRGVRYGVHAVFPYCEPHGDVYAYVSRWLSACMSRGRLPYVPHIVELPNVNGDLRESLGIPASAVVFGRHGGYDTFDIPWAWKAIEKTLERRQNAWFVFLNTAPGVTHPRVIHLEATADPVEKVRFINTCDAMLHARRQGETFGLAPAEFSACNKQVFTYGRSHERAHIDMLGDKAILYRSESDLVKRLESFQPRPDEDWNAYRGFRRDVVMDDFERVFLSIEHPVSGERSAVAGRSAAKGCSGPYWIVRRAIPARSPLRRLVPWLRRSLRGGQ